MSLHRLLGIEELADLLGVPKGSIYRWQTIGYGPTALKVGKHLRWDPLDVERWLDEQKESARP